MIVANHQRCIKPLPLIRCPGCFTRLLYPTCGDLCVVVVADTNSCWTSCAYLGFSSGEGW